MHKSDFHAAKTQQGAILVVSLVMLLILTVLGISTMNTASLELNMAGNERFSENAFQAAETGIDQTINGFNNGVPTPNTVNAGITPPFGPAQLVDPGNPESFRLTLTYLGETLDMTGGFSVNKFSQQHFEIESQGIAPPRARSWHHQGFFTRGTLNDDAS